MSGCSASSGMAVVGHRLVAEAGHAEHVEDQHAVVRDDRAAALGDDRRMRHAGLVAHGLDVVDDVVGVFLRACSSRSIRSWSASRRSRCRGRRRRRGTRRPAPALTSSA